MPTKEKGLQETDLNNWWRQRRKFGATELALLNGACDHYPGAGLGESCAFAPASLWRLGLIELLLLQYNAIIKGGRRSVSGAIGDSMVGFQD